MNQDRGNPGVTVVGRGHIRLIAVVGGAQTTNFAVQAILSTEPPGRVG